MVIFNMVDGLVLFSATKTVPSHFPQAFLTLAVRPWGPGRHPKPPVRIGPRRTNAEICRTAGRGFVVLRVSKDAGLLLEQHHRVHQLAWLLYLQCEKRVSEQETTFQEKTRGSSHPT